jgi:hypothetical protein
MVCGAKRIRSLYLPWMTAVPPKLSTTAPPKGPASFSTINDATMRLCGAGHPCLVPSDSGWKPLPQDKNFSVTLLVLAGLWPPRDYELA